MIRNRLSFSISAVFILFLIISIFTISCSKEDITDNNPAHKLGFSTDTILFDTVFTTIGSSTRTLMVYNKHKNKINISSIRLARGTASPFRINVDGKASVSVSDMEIAGKDSMYVFIKVTINPNNADSPLIQSDSILFEVNGNLQYINLVAWGQDAHFYRNAVLGSDYVFTNDKPHVIYGYFAVDSLYTLTIQPGAQIYFHKDSYLYVYRDGTLKVNGTLEQPVIFQGDRLEDDYLDIPGQWGKIWLSVGSKNNEINYAVIKNGTIGLQVDTLGNSSNPTLILNNTLIYNMSAAGLLGQGTYIRAANCVFGNCGQGSVVLQLGGDYDFRNCTIGNFWDYSVRQNTALVLNNYYYDTDNHLQARALTNAYFGNCVVYGNQWDEITLDKKDAAVFNYLFENCLLKTELNISNETYFKSCIKNEDPWFANTENNNFEPDSTVSAVIDKGALSVIQTSYFDITRDLKGNYRIADVAPDMGAYEFMPPANNTFYKKKKSTSHSRH